METSWTHNGRMEGDKKRKRGGELTHEEYVRRMNVACPTTRLLGKWSHRPEEWKAHLEEAEALAADRAAWRAALEREKKKAEEKASASTSTASTPGKATLAEGDELGDQISGLKSKGEEFVRRYVAENASTVKLRENAFVATLEDLLALGDAVEISVREVVEVIGGNSVCVKINGGSVVVKREQQECDKESHEWAHAVLWDLTTRWSGDNARNSWAYFTDLVAQAYAGELEK
jgi:hypothetical protein